MGIDAEMFVRTKIRPSLEAPGTPMGIVDDVRAEIGKNRDGAERAVKHWAWEACVLFRHESFGVYRPDDPSMGQFSRHALELVDEIHQDGPTIKPKKGEWFIRVSLMTRYWGPGYERGDLAFLLLLAQWLENKIPGGEVWYGGDSSGVLHEPFGPDKRAEFVRHAALKGCEYRTSNWMSPSGSSPTCDFCEEPMTSNMGGGGKTGFFCHGCGLHVVVYQDGRRVRSLDGYADSPSLPGERAPVILP